MKKATIIVLIIITFSCHSYETSNFEYNPTSIRDQEMFLSNLADDVSYINLDNTVRIGYITDIKIIKNAIFIQEKDIGVIRYDKKGKNPIRIGKIGRGPGEYQICKSFAINEFNGMVYILSSGKNILVYNQNGVFIRNIPLTGFETHFDGIEFLENNLVISEDIKFGKAKYNWIIIDTSGKIIREKKNPISSFKSKLGMHGGITKCKNGILYWNIYNDTIYSIQPNLKYRVLFLFEKGNHRIPTSEYDPINFMKYMRPYQIIDTKNYFILFYFYFTPKLDLIDKHSKEIFSTDIEIRFDQGGMDINGGILNDFDSGLSFHPISYFYDNYEYLIGWINSYELRDFMNATGIKGLSSPKYPEKKKELEKLAASLKETDNPVLVLVRLKE